MPYAHHRLLRIASCCLLTLCAAAPAWALDPSQVLILVNKDQGISSRVASMYQKLRGIPATNILRLSLGTERHITAEVYWKQAAGPIQTYLTDHPAIACILTTSGVPYTVASPEGTAFDSELAAVLRTDPAAWKSQQPNPLYLGGMNFYGITDARALKMVYVTRLDGPDLATITRMVEDAVAVEKTGLSGPVYGDAQGIDGISGYGLGDFSIRAAMDRLSGAGLPATLDMKHESWKQPKGAIGNQAEGAAFYIGWYDLLDFQDIFGERGLARGSIAWHIASQEGQNLWDGKGWCLNLMRRGAAVTLGPVREPYVTAFPHGDIFVEGLLSGLTVAESYWLSLPHVSWAMAIMGDPLYRPFAFKLQPALIARGYVAANSTNVLQKGETSALLVQIDCVGPVGSFTPAFVAQTGPEMGLAAASGQVSIPSLKAGGSAVVRIPSVTAGNDPTGMFRLHLDGKDDILHDTQGSRRIVLEGRIGFSRLAVGLAPQSQISVNPTGDSVFSGLPARAFLVDTATLRATPVAPPQGFLIRSAEFSTDGSRVAVALLDLQQKKNGVVIADNKFGNVQSLPAGSQFLRWLEPDRFLLKVSDGLLSRSLSGSPDRAFDVPPGQAGNVIPESDIVVISTQDGKLGFKKGGEPFREVLQGVKLTPATAIANDLSLFGGLDAEKRLWIQHGLDQKPEIVATGVERVLWGPISRRVVIEGADKKSRVYDGRDRSWIDLGMVSAAEWSPDEERLLFLERKQPSEMYLSLLDGRRIVQLCDAQRMGTVMRMAFSRKSDRAFLLAGLSGQPNVWMIAIPAKNSSK